MTTNRIFILILVVFSCALYVSGQTGMVKRVITKTDKLDFGAGGTVAIMGAPKGSIHVEAAEKNEIEINRQLSTEDLFLLFSAQLAKDFAQLSQTKLTMPVLAIGGDKSLGNELAEQMKLVATDVTVVVLKDTGHWILEERPKETSDALVKFL
jgi:pimeloyl-ACP methyl ester carboxylesterase